ncbi:hypothetical protein FKM82_006165 [Ascaphus truei]
MSTKHHSCHNHQHVQLPPYCCAQSPAPHSHPCCDKCGNTKKQLSFLLFFLETNCLRTQTKNNIGDINTFISTLSLLEWVPVDFADW